MTQDKHMSSELATKIFRAQGYPPHGFKVALSEDIVPDPETKEPVKIYYLLFKNDDYQEVAKSSRQHLVDVARWLKDAHDAMRSVGLRVIIQPVFDQTPGANDGLTPDQLKYKLQEIINKK